MNVTNSFFVVKAGDIYYHYPQKFFLILKYIYEHLHSLKPVLASQCFHYGIHKGGAHEKNFGSFFV